MSIVILNLSHKHIKMFAIFGLLNKNKKCICFISIQKIDDTYAIQIDIERF